jgi:hypothetical protein
MSSNSTRESLRFRSGDLAICGKTGLAAIWCPNLIGKVAIVVSVEYGSDHHGTHDMLMLNIPDEKDWSKCLWYTQLWSRITPHEVQTRWPDGSEK